MAKWRDNEQGTMRYAVGRIVDLIARNVADGRPIDGLVLLLDAVSYPLAKDDEGFRTTWRKLHVHAQAKMRARDPEWDPDLDDVPLWVRYEEVRHLWDLLYRRNVVVAGAVPWEETSSVFADEGDDDEDGAG